MEFLRRIREQLRQVWQGMSFARQTLLAVVVIASLALVGIVGYWAFQPDYRILYSGLSPDDAGAVITRLQTQGVPHQVSPDGTTIRVPADQLQQLRLALATEGLPVKGSKGFELFDESPLGMTPFVQHVNYYRALQGELARSIMQIEPIAFARVTIAVAESSPFIREKKPTTASVVLRLKPGAKISRSQAASIVALVSHGVEGLAPENVTVVDANGKVLSEPQSPETGAVASQLDYRKTLESYLASKAEDMLAQLLGPGRAIVRVTADINFQRLKERRETFTPDGRVGTSEKTVTSRSTTTSSGPRGVAGTASNLPPTGRTSVGSGGGGSSSQEETTQTDYAVSKIVQELEDKLGSVDRLTIAALVDLASPGGADGQTKPALTLIDAQDIIKQAVGFKTDRDEIKVNDVRLTATTVDTAQLDAEWEKVQYWQTVVNIVRNGSLGIAAVVALILGWMLLRLLGPAASPRPAGEADERARVVERLTQSAQRDPQAVARALAAWLAQPESTARSAR